MEVSAKVFAIAKNEETLKKIYEIMKEHVPVIAEEDYYVCKPAGIDDLVQLDIREYDTCRFEESDPDNWEEMLRECGSEVGEDGAVIVVFRSPDSDTFEQHTTSTASGDVLFCDTEFDFSDFAAYGQRMDDFKDQFTATYKSGEKYFQWYQNVS